LKRMARRKAIGGIRLSRSSAQAVFIAWEEPSTRAKRITAETR
jgi:hypothetical protein